jgi:hypothetical protein
VVNKMGRRKNNSGDVVFEAFKKVLLYVNDFQRLPKEDQHKEMEIYQKCIVETLAEGFRKNKKQGSKI